MTAEHARALERERKRLAQFRERAAHRDKVRRWSRERRERDRAGRPRFTCARCGREFEAGCDGESTVAGRAAARFSQAVRIGGRPWCERCAEARFPRRPDPDCPLGADRIELSARPTAARIHQ